MVTESSFSMQCFIQGREHDNEFKHQTTQGQSGFERMKCSEHSKCNEVPDKSSLKYCPHTHSLRCMTAQSRLDIYILLFPCTVQYGHLDNCGITFVLHIIIPYVEIHFSQILFFLFNKLSNIGLYLKLAYIIVRPLFLIPPVLSTSLFSDWLPFYFFIGVRRMLFVLIG